MPPTSLFLTGFMGSGKSTVGPLVARALGLPFVDLDAAIEARAGRSIATLFAGGEATFRRWERRLLAEALDGPPAVIATGGGALVGLAARALLAGQRVIVLDLSLEEARRRLAGGERPLAAELAARYARRAPHYARLSHHVVTDGRSPEAVAAEVVALADLALLPPAPPPPETLTVPTPDGASYDILVGEGATAGLGDFIASRGAGKVALVSDETVAALWGEAIRHDLLAAGLPTTLLALPPGEAHKTLASAAALYDGFATMGLGRGDAVVALGGGVVGDVAAFAAATWMRGAATVVQLPTTLLAMVDASIGGKTGVDHPRGKNLIGAFRFPDTVLVEPRFLDTLPTRERAGGMAEVIKHALIADPALWATLAARDPAALPDAALIARALRVKAEIVARDPWERGERAKLNLGHTFGHAFELASGYALPHGEAVALGMIAAARLAVALGVAETGLAGEVEAMVARYGLPTRWDGAREGEAIWAAMALDKKAAAGGLRLVLPRAVGDVVVTAPGEAPRAAILAAVAGLVGADDG